jgi:hypothetical protein
MENHSQGRDGQSPEKTASMTHNIKIATWNVCLGLASKKDLVKKYILDNNIDEGDVVAERSNSSVRSLHDF